MESIDRRSEATIGRLVSLTFKEEYPNQYNLPIEVDQKNTGGNIVSLVELPRVL